MTLPVTNLDDRRFQDIVDEAKRMIPQLCPEWTNHNLSDPGVALIELFAWMTESTLFRLNQVPDVFYTRMLNLLGFEQFPASAARVPVTFWCAAGEQRVVTIPKGTEVSTVGTLGESRVFTTLEDAAIVAPQLIGAMTSDVLGTYTDVWEDLSLEIVSVPIFPRDPMRPDDCFYLGFEQSLAGHVIRLDIKATVEGIGVVPHRPPLVWEVWQGEGWVPAEIPDLDGDGQIADSTGGLNRDGEIVLVIPSQHEPLTLGGSPRLLDPCPAAPGRAQPPGVPHVAAPLPRPRRGARGHGRRRTQRADRRGDDRPQHGQARPDVPQRPLPGPATRGSRDARGDRRRRGADVDRGDHVHRFRPRRPALRVGVDHRGDPVRPAHSLTGRHHAPVRRDPTRRLRAALDDLPDRGRRGGQRRRGHADRPAVDHRLRHRLSEPRRSDRRRRRRVRRERQTAWTADAARRQPCRHRVGLRAAHHRGRQPGRTGALPATDRTWWAGPPARRAGDPGSRPKRCSSTTSPCPTT